MKQPMPWSVKGVDSEARETAKEAARRAGMTLGEWLNAMIAENAAEAERDTREEAMADIAERLARLDRSASAAAAMPRAASGNDLESVLRRAMAETRQQTQQVEERTAGALESMMRWMERSEGRRREDISVIAAATERTSTALRDALGLVTARMDQIERSVAGQDTDSLRRAIERLESRIERLDARPQSDMANPRVEASLRELEGRLVSLADRMAEPGPAAAHAERIGRIESALGTILDRLDGVGAGKVAEPAPGSLEDAISQIRARQAMLDREDAMPSAEAVSDLVTRSLKGDIDQLARRLEDLRPADTGPDLAALRGDLADIARTVRGLDPNDRLASLESGLASLGRYVDELRAVTPKGDDLRRPLERITSDIASIGQSLDPLRDVAALRADIAGLASRIDSAQAEPEGPTAADIAADIAALRRDVEAATAQAVPVEAIERRLEAMTGVLEQIASLRTDAEIAELRNTTRDVRGLIEAMPDFKAVERRFETLAERLHVAAAPVAAEPAAFPLDDLVARLSEKLDEARAPDATSGSFDALERQIAAMTEALGRTDESFASVQSLERSVASLFAKLEETARASSTTAERAAELAARSVAETVAEQIARVGEQARASDAEPGAQETLTGVQSALDRIIDKLAGLEAGLASGRNAPAVPASGASTDFQPPAPKADPAAAANAVAEKIAAAAAAAKAAKNADVVKSRSVPVSARKDEALRATAMPAAAQFPVFEPVAPAARDTETEALAAAARAAAQNLLAQLEPAAPAPGQEAPAGEAGESEKAPVPDPEPYELADDGKLALDLPLEPGSGRPAPPEARTPDGPALPADAEAPAHAKTSFIAAAREAMLANQAGRKARKAEKADAAAPARSRASVETLVADAALKNRMGSVVERTRRPILIGLGVVVLALGAAHVVRNAMTGGEPERQGIEKPSASPSQSGTADRPAEAGRQSALPADPATTGALPPQSTPEKKTAAPTGPELPSTLLTPDSAGQPSGFTPPRPPADAGAAGRDAVPLVDPATIAMPPLNDLARALLPAALQKAATGGNAAAAFEVGVRLQEGRGIPRDAKLASRWFERAALLGLAPAQYRLGSMYEKGIGVSVDIAQARLWYERAAARGNAKAMHNLGVLSADGSGGKPDYAGAAVWFRKAAELGVRDSQYNLAILSARGLGIAQNLVDSYMWFSLAAAQGDEDAGRKREDVAARLDPTALATAKAAAASFKPLRQDEAANDVAPPPGGWDEPTAAQKEKAKAVRS